MLTLTSPTPATLATAFSTMTGSSCAEGQLGVVERHVDGHRAVVGDIDPVDQADLARGQDEPMPPHTDGHGLGLTASPATRSPERRGHANPIAPGHFVDRFHPQQRSDARSYRGASRAVHCCRRWRRKSHPLPPHRVDLLIDPGTAFLELSPLAANGLYGGDVHSASVITGIGHRSRGASASSSPTTPPSRAGPTIL
jgi:hypothetical protein